MVVLFLPEVKLRTSYSAEDLEDLAEEGIAADPGTPDMPAGAAAAMTADTE